MASTSCATWAALPTSVWIKMYALTATKPSLSRCAHPSSGVTTEGKGRWARPANSYVVEEHERLVRRVGEEQDDVLCTLQLVAGDSELAGRQFDQLVDLLVEAMFLELRGSFLAGELDRDGYVDELANLADRGRHAGVLPLPSRGAS